MIFEFDVLLLDIEGTTSSISFVHDEMFPYVRENLDSYLKQEWESDDLTESIDLIRKDAGLENWPDPTLSREQQIQQVSDEVIRQMDLDLKATGLKNLQGKIWKNGFESGRLRAHLFDDVKPALERFKAQGRDLRIYSSGSVQAQLLFFKHTVCGDLLPLFSAHYDTQVGGKKEVDSYRVITQDVGLSPDRILFVSDIPEELDAAMQAGLQTAISIRPGNSPIAPGCPHPAVHSFADIESA